MSGPHVPSLSLGHWARRLAAGTPTSKLCSPRESVLRRPHSPGQAEAARRCSPGIPALQSSLHHGSGFGLSRRPTQEARGLVPRESPGAQPSRLHSATRTPTPGFANPGSVDTQGRSNPAHHRRATTQLTRASRAQRAPVASPVLTPLSERAHGRSVLLVPPLGGTPRLPILHDRLPAKGTCRWTSETLRRTVDQIPPLTRQAGGRSPRGARPRRPLPGRRQRDWLSPAAPLDPPLREEQVGGGPPCCQVGRLSWAFVPRRTSSNVRASGGAGHIRLSGLAALRTLPLGPDAPSPGRPRSS